MFTVVKAGTLSFLFLFLTATLKQRDYFTTPIIPLFFSLNKHNLLGFCLFEKALLMSSCAAQHNYFVNLLHTVKLSAV